MLSELFSTKERVMILELVLTEKGLTNSEISNRAGLNKGLVSIYLRKMEGWGLVEKIGRRYVFRSTPLVKQLKILINLANLKDALERLSQDIISLGVYGSYASGDNTSDSDIDIWVYMDRSDNIVIGELSRRISEMSGHEVNIIVLTDEKLKSLKRSDGPFYTSLLNGSIVMYGDGFGQAG